MPKELTITEFARMGGKARAAKTTARQRQRWSAKGGKERAARHTPEELRAFAATGGRQPWKLTPAVQRRILEMLNQGRKHQEIADKFDVSLRAIGRLVARQRQKEIPPAKKVAARRIGKNNDTNFQNSRVERRPK